MNLTTLLNERFHLESFRPGQQEAIETLLEKGSLLCILPTGYGKSLLYQLPAVILEGVTIVVSPLLALMRDQLFQLETRFAISAGSINSDQSDEENEAVRSKALSGKLKILFLAPEQLDNLSTLEFLNKLAVSLLVIDEAHCISVWGHDFRPSYRRIITAIETLQERTPNLKLLALTATANEKTELDIVRQLTTSKDLELTVHRHPMDRPNLSLSVVPIKSEGEKLLHLEKLITDDGTLIYCATRDNTALVAEFLSSRGRAISAYHAGLESDLKRELQNRFLSGELKCVAATNALGMGIDRKDIRHVIHFDVPGSLTAYYQEVGRAGRDGLPARGTVLFYPGDLKIQEHFIKSAQPSLPDFERILATIPKAEDIAKGIEAPGLMTIKSRSGLHPTIVTVVLAELLEQTAIQKQLVGKKQVYLKASNSGELDISRYTTQFELRTFELEQIKRYCTSPSECLMSYLRVRLGDSKVTPCCHCSVCIEVNLEKDDSNTSESDLAVVDSWLMSKPVIIQSSTRPHHEEGLAVLDGTRHSLIFAQFMRERRSDTAMDLYLEKLVKLHLQSLKLPGQIDGVIVLPSTTWVKRKSVGQQIAKMLGVDCYLDTLFWNKSPIKRQGELLNNDQRRENVKLKMIVRNLPAKNFLLVDDYTGSGATLKEAARALTAVGAKKIVPFTIARVKWRLGEPGMI